jgi:type I restriction enzyme M protein
MKLGCGPSLPLIAGRVIDGPKRRKESERFKSFPYAELAKRDKLNLDIVWLKDESLEDSANLPAPDIIAAEIAEDLQAALAQFAEIAFDLKRGGSESKAEQA